MRSTSLVVLLLISLVVGTAQGKRTHAGETEPGLFDALLNRADLSTEEELRRLSIRRDFDATKRVLTIAKSMKDLPPLAVLELSRALYAHQETRFKRSVLKAQRRIFSTRREIKKKQRARARALEHLARGTAALALAQADDPAATRILMAQALETEGHDEEARLLAKDALEQFPPSPQTAAKLDSLLERSEKAAAGNLETSPFRLCKKLASLRDSDLLSLLKQHVQADQLAPAFNEKKSLDKSLRHHPAWTLRLMTILSTRKDFRKVQWLIRAAEQRLVDSNPIERSSAAWALAVVSPEKAAALLRSEDPVIVNAVLRQAHEGPLAMAVARLASSRKVAPRAADIAQQMSLLAPSTWALWSTRELWTLARSVPESTAHIAAIAARFSSTSTKIPLGQLETWLADPADEIRSAVSRGLGENDSPTARGLLIRAYHVETSPFVRRIQAHAFADTPQGFRKVLAIARNVDPDREVRTNARRESDVTRGFWVQSAVEKSFRHTDRAKRTLLGFAAPDGFTGIVGRDL